MSCRSVPCYDGGLASNPGTEEASWRRGEMSSRSQERVSPTKLRPGQGSLKTATDFVYFIKTKRKGLCHLLVGQLLLGSSPFRLRLRLEV